MEKSEETKIIYFQSASVKKDLSNLPQELEYLLIVNLSLDGVLNLPIGLKEIHINYCLGYVDDIMEHFKFDKNINNIFLKIPYGCEIFTLDTDSYITFNNNKRKRINIANISNCKVSKSDIMTLKLYTTVFFSDSRTGLSEYKDKINVKYGKSGLKQIRFSN